MPTYYIPITVDLGKTLRPVGEVVDSVNDCMADFGFHEKMCVRSEICTMTLTTEKPLTMEEKLRVQELMQKTYEEKLSDKDIQAANPEEWRQ